MIQFVMSEFMGKSKCQLALIADVAQQPDGDHKGALSITKCIRNRVFLNQYSLWQVLNFIELNNSLHYVVDGLLQRFVTDKYPLPYTLDQLVRALIINLFDKLLA